MAAWTSVMLDCRLLRGLALACLLAAMAGCNRADEEAEVPFIYDLADYDLAETAATGQVRNRLEQQNIEMRDLWLGLRPVEDGPPELSADVDAYCNADQTEEISRLVAEIILNALPKHETVQVRVYWWKDVPGDDWAHLAGIWTWDTQGQLLDYMRPEEIHEARQHG